MWIIFVVLIMLINTTISVKNARILEGRPAALGEFPMQAVIVDRGSWKLLCGGSIITKQTILTAAHCLVGYRQKQIKQLRAIVGDITLQKTEKSPASRKIYRLQGAAVHNRSSLMTITNDIAIVRIVGSFEISNNVRIASLGRKKPAPGLSCTVSGYGLTDTEKSSEVLLAKEVSVLDQYYCRNRHPGFDAHTMICAGNTTSTNNPCFGDSGGPLLCGAAKIQVGIVSFYPECTGPASYTYVTAFTNWIATHRAGKSWRKITKRSARKSKANKLFDEIFVIVVATILVKTIVIRKIYFCNI